MDAIRYARLASVVFAIVAVLQLARAVMGWPASVDGRSIPIAASWAAAVLAGGLAWLGYTAKR